MDGTIVGAIRRHAAAVPDRVALRTVTFRDGRTEVTARTYAELDLQARALAARLQRSHRPGDRVLLGYPDGMEQATAIIGALYAGMIPVVLPLPQRSQPHQVQRSLAIIADARVSVVLTDADRQARLAQTVAAAGLAGVRCVATDQESSTDAAQAWCPPDLRPRTPAYLQYTSGSTGEPRGVVVSHGAVVHNVAAIRELADDTHGGILCGWLPLHHDMGLVGQLFTPLYVGESALMMSPSDFVLHPGRWLELIAGFRAGFSAAPSFALDLCRRRVTDEQLARLDLSCLRVLLVGAEPIAAGTVAGFVRRFAGAGMDPTAVKPAYGLAEATLMVTTTPAHRGYRTLTADVGALQRGQLRAAGDRADMDAPGRAATVLVGCGVPTAAIVRIVDPGTRAVLPDGQVGEIWVAGRSVATGYWRRPELTAATFGARTRDGDGPYLRTGDLGAMRDGELYVTGRLKEVIIVHGRTIHPYDAERTLAGLHPAFSRLGGCIVAVTCAADEPVAVQELRGGGLDEAQLAGITRLVREELTAAMGIAVRNVVLVPPGAVMRTTSGKIERLAVRDAFLSGRLRTVYEDLTPAIRSRREQEQASGARTGLEAAGRPA